ncbi:reprolysin-like metallopeptidase [Hyphobacterium indicum]|uniref:reprolysin-like metallopeptidase n=1 Tax=Hyphobacterium indicum TaxID=2162714 RepID=UPI000D64A1FD|nr:M12 family metallo-peptidase [Hyphobacterium indicum]
MHRILAGLAVSVAVSVSAFGQDMFTNVESISAADGGPDIIRFDGLSPDVMRMSPGDTVALNFGPGYVAELDRMATQSMGAQVWVGRLEGGSLLDRILITETNGHAFGRIVTEDGIWHIIPEGNGHRIMQMPASARPRMSANDMMIPDPLVLARLAEAGELEFSGEIAEAVPVGSNGIIDIAVFYSQSMTAHWGLATGGRIQYLMAVLDQALVDSDTGLRARLVHLDSVNLTTDNADQGVTLENLSGNPNGNAQITQDLSALRAAGVTYGADLVGIIQRALPGQTSCGIAWTNGTNGTMDASNLPFGYSVSADWLTPDQSSLCDPATFAHEIGHNMGFVHNVEETGQVGGGVRTFAHGHRVDCNFNTIMSYPSTNAQIQACPAGSPNGIGGETTAFFFSNPELMRCPPNGTGACGRPFNDADPADVARAAREESRNVVNFRAEAPRVVSSVLPITRSVQNGTVATAFATIINPAATGSTATGCGLRLAGTTPAQFSYQTTTPANALSGTANTPADIAAGGAQNFVFSVTSATDFADNQGLPQASTNNETHLFVEAFCSNRRSGEYTLGLNSLIFSSSPTPVPDIVALATSGDPGRVNVPTTGNFVGVFAVAISNVGAAGTITASGDTGGRALAIQNIEVCPTNPATGVCTSPRAATAQLNVGANGTATFGVFVRGNGQAIANDPAQNRVFVRFNEGANARGATSVAVRTQ